MMSTQCERNGDNTPNPDVVSGRNGLPAGSMDYGMVRPRDRRIGSTEVLNRGLAGLLTEPLSREADFMPTYLNRSAQ